MKITITSTGKIVRLAEETNLSGPTYGVPARVWEGVTDSGVPVHCFITRIAPTIPKDDPRNAEFQRELQECEPPSAAVAIYPLKMIL